MRHQYIDRATGQVVTESLRGDGALRLLYGTVREHTPSVFKALTSARSSRLLAWWNFDSWLGAQLTGSARFLAERGIDRSECVAPERLKTWREVFERQIRYWEVRPMPSDHQVVVSPADARALVLEAGDPVFVKEKFFSLPELVGDEAAHRVRGGSVVVLRLTPERYHYTHAPVAGVVTARRVVDGVFHACNPSAVVVEVTPYSKNRRVVTVIDTDVAGGSQVGQVVLVEVVALMVGALVSCASHHRYEAPTPLEVGHWVTRGAPLSLFRPGSSSVVVAFEPGRVAIDGDLLEHQRRLDVESRFSRGFGEALVETEVRVRQSLGRSSRHAARAAGAVS